MKFTSILSELESEGYVIISVRGISMQPLLYTNRSQVLIRRLEKRPKKNDVVLYVRPDGEQVLHRIIGFDGDVCLIRGDNTFGLERVPLDQVKGVMETVWRHKREIQVSNFLYKLYVRFWNLIYPLRWLIYQIKLGIRRLGKKVLGNTSLAWVVNMVRGSLPWILLMAICSGTEAGLSVAGTLVMREAIDSAVAKNAQGFLQWAVVFMCVILGMLVLNAVIRQLDEWITASIENRLKLHTYKNILCSSYSELKAFHTGELQNRLTGDVQIVAENAAEMFPDIVSLVVEMLCTLIVLIMIDWRFGSIFLIGGLMMLCVTFLLRRKMKNLHKNVQTEDGKLRSWMQESVGNLLIVKSFQAEQMALERTEELAEKHKYVRMRRRTYSNMCSTGFGTVMQGSYLFGLVWCCLGILNGRMTYGTLIAVMQLINRIGVPFANISGFVPQYYAMLASAERLIELEKLSKDTDAGTPLPAFRALHARELTFIYDDGVEKVIRDASFDIQRGELVALTGISGIGKSTLLKMLLGIYCPTSGKLYADVEIAGDKDVKEVNIDASTRGWFSYVPQGNMLISGSIYEAIDFLHSAPYSKQQKERIEQACKVACADEFICELPDGYDTILGEKGTGLSEGQIQRIAIARAIYRNAPVLLLDEATSALDEMTEHRILENLKNLGDQTVLIVTHRPAALEICKKRLVFEDSRIFEEEV